MHFSTVPYVSTCFLTLRVDISIYVLTLPVSFCFMLFPYPACFTIVLLSLSVLFKFIHISRSLNIFPSPASLSIFQHISSTFLQCPYVPLYFPTLRADISTYFLTLTVFEFFIIFSLNLQYFLTLRVEISTYCLTLPV